MQNDPTVPAGAPKPAVVSAPGRLAPAAPFRTVLTLADGEASLSLPGWLDAGDLADVRDWLDMAMRQHVRALERRQGRTAPDAQENRFTEAPRPDGAIGNTVTNTPTANGPDDGAALRSMTHPGVP